MAVLLVAITTVTITESYGEIWKVKIPSGAVGSDTHFLPKEITVRPNDTVEWANGDAVTHTITSGSIESGPNDRFDSNYLDTGEKFRYTFKDGDMGENKYFCTIHPWLTGIVNVAQVGSGFKVIHNVGDDVTDSPFDVHYKVQRNLVEAKIDPARAMIVFSFEGKVDNDIFTVKLPQSLIKNIQGVWIDDVQFTKYESTQTDEFTILMVPLDGTAQEIRLVGTEVAGEAKSKPFTLINQILAVTDKQIYNPSDTIVISGIVKNPNQLSRVTINVVSPGGVVLNSERATIENDTRFASKLPTNILREFGTYEVKIEGMDARPFTIPFDYKSISTEKKSPREQLESGIQPSNIACNYGFELIFKSTDGSPACVFESSVAKLFERGWDKADLA